MKKSGTIRGQLLTEVAALVNVDRNATHGDPVSQHATAAVLWNEFIKRVHLQGRTLDAADVCQMLVLLKTSRYLSGNRSHSDNFYDQAGYAAITYECIEELKKPEAKQRT